MLLLSRLEAKLWGAELRVDCCGTWGGAVKCSLLKLYFENSRKYTLPGQMNSLRTSVPTDNLPWIWTGHTIIRSATTTLQWITTIYDTFARYWEMSQSVVFLFHASIWHWGHSIQTRKYKERQQISLNGNMQCIISWKCIPIHYGSAYMHIQSATKVCVQTNIQINDSFLVFKVCRK